MRFSLNEKEFREIIVNGYTVVNGVTISLSAYEIEEIIKGEVVYQMDKMIILQDIGYDRIYDILKHRINETRDTFHRQRGS
jgi:hypothetical protein